MGSVLFLDGDILEGGKDLSVLPCSAKGNISNATRRHVDQYGIPLPPPMPLGEIRVVPFPGPGAVTKAIAWAASVLNDSSSPEVIENIGRELGSYVSQHRDLRLIECPLLGTGAGHLEPLDSGLSLRRGFIAACALDATLIVYAYQTAIVRSLRAAADASESSMAPPTTDKCDINRIRFEPANTEDYWRNHPLREFHVPHLSLSVEVIDDFQACLDKAVDERPVQAFLERHPGLLAQLLHAAPRFVFPRQRLGAEFVPDFIIGEQSSDGYDWLAIELENPRHAFFTNGGDPRAELSHAIRQIQDWRAWLNRNQNYASRSRVESGLGLTDISAALPGMILMGRRAIVAPETKELRRQMASDLRIQIHTYDHLIDVARTALAR